MQGISPPNVPAMKQEITFSQANPVSGTKYTVLDTAANVRILGIYALVTWTVQPNPLEVHITIDGQALVATQANPVSNTMYFVTKGAVTQFNMSVTDMSEYIAFLLEGRSVKVEVETTGGTVSQVDCYLKYQQY